MYLHRTRYLHFFITGASGVGINLTVTAFFAELVFGREQYFLAYLIGVAANLLYNFTLHTVVTFKTKEKHVSRLAFFVIYSLVMTYIQTVVVRTLVSLVGVDWYLVVIGGTIFFFSIITFLLFKFFLFNDGRFSLTGDWRIGTRCIPKGLAVILGASFLLHVGVLVFAVSVNGVQGLIFADAQGYIDVARNIALGEGFVRTTPQGPVPELFRSVGFPLLLAPFALTSGGMFLYLALTSLAGAVLVPALLYYIGKELFRRRVGLIAAALVAFEPLLIAFSVLPFTEIPFIIFFLAGIASLLRAHRGAPLLWGSFAGVLVGYAVLIRPGMFGIVLVAGLCLLLASFLRRRGRKTVAAVALGFVLVLLPWSMRMFEATGTFTLSGLGWRNVFTDYVSSVRSVAYGTNPAYERNYMKTVRAGELGLTREDLNNPAYAPLLRDAALAELSQHIPTILVLEPFLLLSFFTNDGYYYTYSKLGFIRRLPSHISPTGVLLEEGVRGVPKIFAQLENQYFIPIVGRVFTVLTLLLSCVALFAKHVRRDTILLLWLVVMLTAFSATLLGLGVEARLRLSIAPLFFLLVAVGHEVLRTRRI